MHPFRKDYILIVFCRNRKYIILQYWKKEEENSRLNAEIESMSETLNERRFI